MASPTEAGFKRSYTSPPELFRVQVDHAHVKSGFLKAGRSQEIAVLKMCKKYETVTKVDVGKDQTIGHVRLMTKVQTFWFDKVVAELQRVRKENEELRKQLDDLKRGQPVGLF